MQGIIILLVTGIVIYLLYDNGYIGITSKAAVVFIGSFPKKTSWQATFTKCKGTMKRIIRFDVSKVYEFTLTSELDDGEVEVEIMNARKQVVLTLNADTTIGNIGVGDNRKYYMVVRIKSATGKYVVSWE